MPQDFNALSFRFEDVPENDRIYIFTDANPQCIQASQTATWEFWKSYGPDECHK